MAIETQYNNYGTGSWILPPCKQKGKRETGSETWRYRAKTRSISSVTWCDPRLHTINDIVRRPATALSECWQAALGELVQFVAFLQLLLTVKLPLNSGSQTLK